MIITESFKYDVFLSHSSKDKPVVRLLAEQLKKDGVRVWFDEWEIEPGHLVGLSIEKGLQDSRVLVLVMSDDAFGSAWVTLERQTALFRDPTNEYRRFIPLLVEDCRIPDILSQYLYIDWREKHAAEYKRLREALKKRRGPQAPKNSIQRKARHKDFQHPISVFVSMSSDGDRVYSGSQDNTIRIWNTETGECVRTLATLSRPVLCIAASGDGKTLVSGVADLTVRIWDLSTGTHKLLRVHRLQVFGIAINKRGDIFATGSADSTIRIWDVQSGDCLHVLTGHTDVIYSVALSEDASTLISGSADHTVRVWNVSTGECKSILKGHRDSVKAVAISEDSRTFVSSSTDGTVRVWNAVNGECLLNLRGHTDEVGCVAISAETNLIVSG